MPTLISLNTLLHRKSDLLGFKTLHITDTFQDRKTENKTNNAFRPNVKKIPASQVKQKT